MDILLASLLMIWGNITTGHPDVTFDQMVQASIQARDAVVVQIPDPNDPSGASGTPIVKIDPQPDAPVVKGIYSTANSAGGSRLERLIQLIDETDLNSIVVDVKDDYGHITFHTDNPDLEAWGTTKKIIPDTHQLIDTLNAHDIYPIARIVVFKDTVLAEKKPDLSFVNSDGTLWKNDNKDAFVNPYKKEVWDYNIEVAKEAAKMGFKEIQFDYVRFAEGFEKRADALKYDKDDRERTQVITDFVQYAREQLNPLGVRVSVDIFGYTTAVASAAGIGQDFNAISKNVDIICPMIYPSHYGADWYAHKVPDAYPYDTISGAVTDAWEKFKEIEKVQPILRPWIQDFTATWVKGHIPYGKKEVEAQIQALEDNGVHEYLLWNSSNVYTPNVEYK